MEAVVSKAIADVVEAIVTAPTSPPRVIPIARPARQPSNACKAVPEAKAHSEAPSATAPTEKGDVRRRPNRIVERIVIDRPWPPDPASAVDEPAAVAIRRPSRAFRRNPHGTVIRHL